MNSEYSLLLNLVDQGLINVQQAERLIRRLRRVIPASVGQGAGCGTRSARTAFVPPHFPGSFGSPDAVWAAHI